MMIAPCQKHPDKIQYPDKESATMAAQRLNILPSHQYKVNVYRCSCGSFHIGKMGKKLNPVKDKDRERYFNTLRKYLKAAKKIKIPKKNK